MINAAQGRGGGRKPIFNKQFLQDIHFVYLYVWAFWKNWKKIANSYLWEEDQGLGRRRLSVWFELLAMGAYLS